MHEREHGEQRFGAAAQTAEWDARCSERDGAMWSGRPNGRLAAEVADLTPGRALDVGCGEGADAIWLARRGWTVTAIDISDVAVGRAREASELAGELRVVALEDLIDAQLRLGRHGVITRTCGSAICSRARRTFLVETNTSSTGDATPGGRNAGVESSSKR